MLKNNPKMGDKLVYSYPFDISPIFIKVVLYIVQLTSNKHLAWCISTLQRKKCGSISMKKHEKLSADQTYTWQSPEQDYKLCSKSSGNTALCNAVPANSQEHKVLQTDSLSNAFWPSTASSSNILKISSSSQSSIAQRKKIVFGC